ncbi:MAG: CT583 family protein [Simkaniaceae bacterium]
MTNANKQASLFFEKKSIQKPSKFNLLPQTPPQMPGFDLQKLDEDEKKKIEELLLNHGHEVDKKECFLDIQKITHITAEVKSISKQGVILIGERIHNAREILKKYGEGQATFTEWLKQTFGSVRTAYNTLSYFDFYSKLPSETLREKLKTLPLKAAYILASRSGELEKKVEIISSYKGSKPNDLIEEIRKNLPLKKGDLRRKRGQDTIRFIEDAIHRLSQNSLTDKERLRLMIVQEKISNLIK